MPIPVGSRGVFYLKDGLFPPTIEFWAGMADNSLGVGNTELWGKRFGLAISQLASRVRGRGGSEAYAPLRVKLLYLAQGER